jgi:hypothetical protein
MEEAVDSIPTRSTKSNQWFSHFLSSQFHPRITQSLLDSGFGCPEDCVQHHLLSRHKLVSVRLRVPIERKGRVALTQDGLSRFGSTFFFVVKKLDRL